MIDQKESEHIFLHAHVPEHLVDYVTSVSGAEPHLFDQFLCYTRDKILIFIGYPLGETFSEKRMESRLSLAIKSLKPEVISLIAPTLNTIRQRSIQKGSDSYYRLELDAFTASPEVQNMVRRAARELSVETGKGWSEEHDSLIKEFLVSHQVSEETRRIFRKIPEYLATSNTATLLSARNNEGALVAIDVADYGSKDYAFYMFNFASRKHYIPGASDLLLSGVIALALRQGKRFINMGLAIHDGIAFFKKKWGGLPFLNHEFILYNTARAGTLESFLGRL